MTKQTGWPGFTTVAVPRSGAAFATVLSGTSAGDIDLGSVPGGSWSVAFSSDNFVQVTQDPIVSNTGYDEQSLYALNSSGQVAGWDATSGLFYFTNSKCGGGTAPAFVQIAAKNYDVYGLDNSGNVWYFATGINTCWKEMTSKTGFAYSIATDNGDFNQLWASDGSGQIWTVD